ncbi:hypothetical protein [Paenibacillus popilliae]|uniref:Uncharacterized protein n=1 Tax=Paenibacillus popilliae ATCC 14706 TaxID=1212764 RepID=M9LQ69_PAEPP|nr:hypothetical protein [Paenibacillus popilliae]GAC42871.1 hypothetical protein PPOP_2232 [Paenibacillus popilliae ATCC 14706]
MAQVKKFTVTANPRYGIVLAGAEQPRVYGQIGSTIGCREHVERAPVVIFLAAAVPAPVGIRI